jgi:hypothetical protein
MCGLFGSITSKNKQFTKEELLQRNHVLMGIAVAMEKRGDHSTGIAYTL